MFQNITLGQYYPVDSILHRLDPRTKLFSTIIFIIIVFMSENVYSILFMTFLLILLIKLSKVPLSFILRGLKGVVFLIVVAGIFNLFLTHGIVIFRWHFISITEEGLKNTIYMIIRIVYIVLVSSLMTLTTTPKSLTDALEKSLGFLNRFKVPVHEMAMMMSIALRYIPILVEETDKIMKAQMSRGATFNHGNIIKRAKSMIPILVPLFVNAFRRATDLALAMEARCYNGGDGRTKLRMLKYSLSDRIAYTFMIFSFILTITLQIMF